MTITEVNRSSQLNVYYGDIHNHCGLSYGKGALSEALQNARLQLDFTSVTVHGHWDDMPLDDPRLDYLVDYHREGFEQANKVWPNYVEETHAANADGTFVTFPSFEWHSMQYGDHCIYFRDLASPEIIKVGHIEDMRERLRSHSSPSLMLPHHIGYKQGFRGINWATFTAEFSPVVEIMSFHGASEHSDALPGYLHAMGPCDVYSTAQFGLAQGKIFGFVGSTDHHSAHPGHYGLGLMGVWAEELSRHAVWDAIEQRRTYALSGDRIALDFRLNDAPMGSVLAYSPERNIEVAVEGGSSIDYIEILHNNRVIHRENVFQAPLDFAHPVKVLFEMGWGEADDLTHWQAQLAVEDGEILQIEPHFRGHDVGVPLDDGQVCAFTHLKYSPDGDIIIDTKTPRNPTVTLSATQSLTLHLQGQSTMHILGKVNDRLLNIPVADLKDGGIAQYLSGFVSPSFVFRRAIPEAEYKKRLTMLHRGQGELRDWYYVRVRQKNGHWAWSSPIWVEKRGD